MDYYANDPNMPIAETNYEPPLSRLSIEQHRKLGRDSRRRKAFRELEEHAAHLLGEISISELKSAVLELIERALQRVGHELGQDGIEVLPHVDEYTGIASIDVYKPDLDNGQHRDKILIGTYARPDAEIFIPADREAWDQTVEALATRLKQEIDKVAAGGEVIDIKTRKNVS